MTIGEFSTAAPDWRGLQSTVEAGWVVVAETGNGRLQQAMLDGRHLLLADEPAAFGGADVGPSPYELLLMALGSCTSMTLRLYAARKEWELRRVVVRMRHRRVHAEDCADCEKTGGLDRIERTIELVGELDAEQRRRLLEIADMCPVHRTLTSSVDIRTASYAPG